MIGFLRGRIASKQPPQLVIDVNGVGYEVDAPMSTFYELPEVGAEVFLHTHLVVREDAQLLYAFASEGERRLFRELIKVSGVGAKVAINILSGSSVDQFARAVNDGDAAALTRLPGIGKKTAERLLVEMRDRLKKEPITGSHAVGGALPQDAVSPADEAWDALVALGYKPQEASRMISKVDTEGLASEVIIRQALQSTVK